MSFFQFSKDQYVKTMDTGEKISMGGFKTTGDGELGNIRVTLNINGPALLVGAESLVMTLYSDSTLTKPIITSAASPLADIIDDNPTFADQDNWIGHFRFDFANENINKDLTYYPALEATGYTRTATLWMGFSYDFPASIYDNGAGLFFNHNLAYQIYTLR